MLLSALRSSIEKVLLILQARKMHRLEFSADCRFCALILPIQVKFTLLWT